MENPVVIDAHYKQTLKMQLFFLASVKNATFFSCLILVFIQRHMFFLNKKTKTKKVPT